MTQTDLKSRLAASGGPHAYPWSNGPGERYAVHAHDYDKILVVERGSIVFGLPSRTESVALSMGDRLDLPAGTDHDATVGSDGVTCLEAHLPAGSLGNEPRRHLGGEW